MAQMLGAFSQPGPWLSLFIGVKMTDWNQTYQNGRVSTYSDVQCGSASRKTSFSRRGNALFRAHFQQVSKTHYSSAEHRRPHCKQDERSSSPRYAVWGIRHPTAENPLHWCKEVGTFKLPTSWVFFKQEEEDPASWYLGLLPGPLDLATFVHEWLRYTLLDQSPLTSEIKWLCVEVDGYKIVKDPDARLCQLCGIFWTTLPDLGSALLNGQITNGKRSTVKVLPGSVLLFPGPVPGLLGWAYPEQLGLSSTAFTELRVWHLWANRRSCSNNAPYTSGTT